MTDAGLVAATVAGIQQLSRTAGDVRAMTAAPADWFRGPTAPVLTKALFQERWFGNGEQGGGLKMFLSSTHPVGLPPTVVMLPPAVLGGAQM